MAVSFHEDRSYINYYVGHGADIEGNWDGCRTIVPIEWFYEPTELDECFKEPDAYQTIAYYNYLGLVRKTEISITRQRSIMVVFSINTAAFCPEQGTAFSIQYRSLRTGENYEQR